MSEVSAPQPAASVTSSPNGSGHDKWWARFVKPIALPWFFGITAMVLIVAGLLRSGEPTSTTTVVVAKHPIAAFHAVGARDVEERPVDSKRAQGAVTDQDGAKGKIALRGVAKGDPLIKSILADQDRVTDRVRVSFAVEHPTTKQFATGDLVDVVLSPKRGGTGTVVGGVTVLESSKQKDGATNYTVLMTTKQRGRLASHYASSVVSVDPSGRVKTA
jgi:hypothetical protein